MTLKSNISIHPFCYMDAEGKISIGNNVSIAHHISILSSNHTWDDLSLPIQYNPMKKGKVIIEDDVWVGCGVRILSEVMVKSRSIIAAGSIVNKDVQSNTIVGGNSAKVLKNMELL